MEFGLKPGLEEIILQCRGIKFMFVDKNFIYAKHFANHHHHHHHQKKKKKKGMTHLVTS
jgi:hypothetical protein